MTIVNSGTFPASGVNLGLAAAPLALAAEVSKLETDISGLGAAVDAQVAVAVDFPPNVAGFASVLALHLDATANAAALAAAFDPANLITLNFEANASLVIELGLIDALIEIVATIVADFEIGLNSGSLAGWSYAGRTAGFGGRLIPATENGFGTIGPDDQISALIVACADFDSWAGFSAGFNTGTSSQEDLGVTTTEVERLRFLGELGGGDWNTGVSQVFARINLFIAELNALKAAIEAQIELSIGLNLPDIEVLVTAGLEIDFELALESLIDVQLDLDVEIGSISARISAILELSGSITASLSGGGLSFWSYTGRAGDLGREFAPEVAGGLPDVATGPGAPAYGIVIATKSPTVWASFGSIFKTS